MPWKPTLEDLWAAQLEQLYLDYLEAKGNDEIRRVERQIKELENLLGIRKEEGE